MWTDCNPQHVPGFFRIGSFSSLTPPRSVTEAFEANTFFHCRGKQKSTCLEGWKDCHRQLWPGYPVPALLQPLTAGAAKRGKGQWFVEQTVPTGMLMSILLFGVSNPKRNISYRSLTAAALIQLTRKVCFSGSFKMVVTPIGQAQSIEWTVPSDSCLPLAAYVSETRLRETFIEAWGWETKDCGGAKGWLK